MTNDHDSAAPRLRPAHARKLKNCRKERARTAIAHALDGESLRDAAGRVGAHPSTVHEALVRFDLLADYKRARVRRIRREHGGKLPALWAKHFADVS